MVANSMTLIDHVETTLMSKNSETRKKHVDANKRLQVPCMPTSSPQIRTPIYPAAFVENI